MRRTAPVLLLAALGAAAGLAAPRELAGQARRPESPASLDGRALGAAGGAIPFSLVVLVPVAGGSERNALTAADGTFRFDSVAPGEYRLRLDRVGYEPEPQPPVRIAAGRRLSAVVRSAPRRLAPLPASAADTLCRAPADAAELPRVATIWRQATIAAHVRRIFSSRYDFTFMRRELDWTVAGKDRVRAAVDETPVVHTPNDAFVEELHASAPEGVWGVVVPQGGLQLVVPDFPDLLGQGFLSNHCVAVLPALPGELRLRIAPRDLMPMPGTVRVAGTIVLDSTYAVTRLEVQYLVDGRVLARGTQLYTDAGFPGGQLRFPSRLDLEEVPRLAGATHWVGRKRYDNYRIAPDTTR